MSKRIISFFLALCMTFTAVTISFTVPETVMKADAASVNYTVFQQGDLTWKDFDPSYGAGCTIGVNGCGLMSIVNAIYYLNGNFVDIKALGEWAYNNGYYGTSGTYRWQLYPNLAAKFGAKYGFTTPTSWKDGSATDSALINHLANGGVAVAHVYNHFICLADYDSSTGRILVLDSSPNYEQRFTSECGNWLSASELSGDSSYMTVDGYCLISNSTARVTNYTATTSVASGSGSVYLGNDYTSGKFGAGSTVFFRAIPASGYKVSSISVNGTAITVQNSGKPYSYSFTMPSANATVSVSFTTGGTTYTNSMITSAASFSLNSGIVVRTDSAAVNSYVGLFPSGTTSYSKDTALFYYSVHEYWYYETDSSTGSPCGRTMQLQSGMRGGNASAYATGTFNILVFNSSGSAVSNIVTITLTGSTTHTNALVYTPSGSTGNTPDDSGSNETLYNLTATVAEGSGTVHFGNNVTSTQVAAGKTINVQTTPAAGYVVSQILVNGTAITVQNSGADCVYQFTMPEKDSTVVVTFTAITYSAGVYEITYSTTMNVRSAPVSGEVIGYVSSGTRITAIEIVNDYWAKIIYNGQIGYVSVHANYASYVGTYTISESDIIFDNRQAVSWVTDSGTSDASVSLASDDTGNTYMQVTASTSYDPQLNMNFSALGDLDASTYKYMVLTARTSASNTTAKMYLCPGSITSPTEDCTVSWQWTNDGLWHDYLIDLSGISSWSDVLNMIRFDFFEGTVTSGSELDLRSVKFYTSKPSSATISTDSYFYNVGDDITLIYSGLDSYLSTQQNQIPFISVYAEGTEPGLGKALLYTPVSTASGSSVYPSGAAGGTALGTTLPVGTYTAWIAYDANGTLGANNLSNVQYASKSSYCTFVITEETNLDGSCITKIGAGPVSGSSTIVAVQDTTVSEAIAAISSLLGASSVTVTDNGETASDTAVFATGMTVTVNSATYTVVIKGDVDSDGSVTIADAASAMSALRGKSSLSSAGRDAIAELSGNTKSLNILDIMTILNCL